VEAKKLAWQQHTSAGGDEFAPEMRLACVKLASTIPRLTVLLASSGTFNPEFF
jgi:hypothetical protein